MVVQSFDETSSVADVTCITAEESCVNRNTLQFTADVFQNVGLAPGSIYLVSIFGSTGPVEGEETALRHVESKFVKFFKFRDLVLSLNPSFNARKNVKNSRKKTSKLIEKTSKWPKKRSKIAEKNVKTD